MWKINAHRDCSFAYFFLSFLPAPLPYLRPAMLNCCVFQRPHAVSCLLCFAHTTFYMECPILLTSQKTLNNASTEWSPLRSLAWAPRSRINASSSLLPWILVTPSTLALRTAITFTSSLSRSIHPCPPGGLIAPTHCYILGLSWYAWSFKDA